MDSSSEASSSPEGFDFAVATAVSGLGVSHVEGGVRFGDSAQSSAGERVFAMMEGG
jgi:hypothetical protein